MTSTPDIQIVPADAGFAPDGPGFIPDADAALAPATRLRWRESMIVVEFLATKLSGQLIDHWPRGDGHPVLVVPGFMAGPGTTRFLRDVLRRLGYRAYDWGLGFNRGHRPTLTDDLIARVRDIQQRTGSRRISLIGQSVGGVFVRELAREVPDDIRSVITLGSPFRGSHRSTHAWRMWELLNRKSADLLSDDARAGRAQPLTTPTTCIYSKSDGVVAWECCTSLPAPKTENVEVCSTHWGYGVNLEALYVVADRLAQLDGQWRPYQDVPA